MRGFLVFCGLALVIGAAWVVLSYLDGPDKDYEDRLVGALNFVEEVVEASQNLRVRLYVPSIGPRSDPGHWALSGIMVTQDNAGGTEQAPFSAILESLCGAYLDPTCWRVKKFAVGGQTVDLAIRVSADLEGTSNGRFSETLVETSVLPEIATAPLVTAPTPVPAEPPLPSEEAGATQATGVSSSVEAEEGILGAADDSEETYDKTRIRLVQQALKKLNYDPGPVDGKLGPRTVFAIETYQRDHDLPVEGQPSRKLLDRMNDEYRDMDQKHD